MSYTYNFKRVLVAFGLVAMAVNAEAQETTADAIRPDSSLVAGRLFSLKKANSTSAVSSVTGDVLYRTATPNLSNTLNGRLAGLTVLQNSGEPGADDALLGIRGNGSYGFGGFGSQRIFVDGFEVSNTYFRNIAPAEIENVSVLKDAAALAPYGMLGSNGVILVTTRRGKAGNSTVQFKTRTGIQQPVNINKPLNSLDFANLYNQAVSNDRGRVWSPAYSEAQLAAYRNGTGTNVDWYSQVLKSRGTYSDADLIFNGGDNTARYNVVFDYANQGGLYDVANTDTSSNQRFKRYNLRTNLDFRMFEIFEAKVDLNGRMEERRLPNVIGTTTGGRINNLSTSPLWSALAGYPSNIYPVKDGNGEWSGTSVYPNNPVASIRDLGFWTYKSRILQGNFELKENLDGITEGLYASQAFSFNSFTFSQTSRTSNYARFFNGTKTTNDQTTPIVLSDLGAREQQDLKQLMATIGYNRKSGNHELVSAVNYNQYDFTGDGFFATYIHYRNFSGRANYTYRNKYVGEIGFSYFGSDAYAPGKRWGFYPAVSAAWIVSNEEFLKNSVAVNSLKIRASAGKTGSADSDEGNLQNQQNGRYLFQQYYSSSTSFYTGDGAINGQAGFNPLYIANQSLRAEKSMKYNAGADISLFKKLDVSLDVFLDKRSGIITRDQTIPGAFGNNVAVTNLGSQTNKGFEINAVYADKSGKLGYSVSGLLFYNKNRIDYRGEVATAYAYNAITGRSAGTPIGLKASGFYDITDFNADGTLKTGIALPAFGAVMPGDIRYEDLDNNGVVDNNDRTAIGKPDFPQMSFSFGGNLDFAGFDLGIFLQGISGSSVNILGSQTQAFVNNGNAFSIAKGAWAYYPTQGIDTRTSATYPRLTTLANDNNYRSSSFWIKDASFLRIRNIELGYSSPQRFNEKTGLSQLRIYVNAVNPATWSRLQKDYNLDPETTFGYPAMKSFNAGLSVTF
jgi:TonB-linked SusC/RagA family outer membrane protein